MLICIDAGHGGYDSGAISGNYVEKTINLDTAKILKDVLERCGFKVALTRSDDTYVPLQDRCSTANYKNADIFISLHVNSYPNANGTETFIHSSNPVKAKSLASKVQNSMVRAFGTKDRGVKLEDFKVLRSTNMTAILCECGFIGSSDMQRITPKLYAESVARGLCEYVGVSYKEENKEDGYYYRVCVGSFKELENANKVLTEVKNKGFKDGFIAKYKWGE